MENHILKKFRNQCANAELGFLLMTPARTQVARHSFVFGWLAQQDIRRRSRGDGATVVSMRLGGTASYSDGCAADIRRRSRGRIFSLAP